MWVRRAELADSDGLAHVHVDSWRATYPGYVPSAVLEALTYEKSSLRWQNNLTSPRADTYVAVDDDDQVAGFVSLGQSRDTDLDAAWGEVYALYVAPSRIRRGIGRLLMAHVVDVARERFRCLHLWVGDQNDNAIGFYEAQGFSLDGRTKNEPAADGTPLGHLRMVRFQL